MALGPRIIYGILAGLMLAGCSGARWSSGQVGPSACQDLEQAYQRGHGTLYRHIVLPSLFDSWADESVRPATVEREALSDTAAVVLHVFEKYFNPRVRRQELDGERYTRRTVGRRTRYQVMPPELPYRVVRDIELNPLRFAQDGKILSEGRISHLLFNIDERLGPIIYLTDDRRAVLECFLGSQHVPLGTGSIMSPAAAWGESASRARFLQGYLPVLHGHWGGYWHLTTHPVVTVAEVTESLDHVLLRIRLGYEGGHALYRREGDQWHLIDHRLTWIE